MTAKDWFGRVRSIFRGRALDDELDDGVCFPIVEAHRGARGARFVEDAWRDVQYGFRQVWRSPALGATVVLSLGIAIGANAAIFSIVDAVMLRRLPYPEHGRIVRVDGVFTRLPLRVSEAGIELARPVEALELSDAHAFVAIGSYVVGG